MKEFLIVIVIFVLVLGFTFLKRTATDYLSRFEPPWPYKSRKPLSDVEQVLYHRLCDALPGCIVLAQVELSRVIQPTTKGIAWHNKINGKSLDFVVCLKDSTIVAAIELDDSSHMFSHRQHADKTKDKALKDAGVTLLRWNVASIPSVSEIKTRFTQ